MPAVAIKLGDPLISKRFAIPIVAGVVVFGGVTAFAAAITVSSKTLGAGNVTVASCNATATATYNTVYAPTVPGYKVAVAPVATAIGCATMAYKVTLYGAAGASLGEVTGVLDAAGLASPDFTSANVLASAVLGIAVVVTG
jgi:hypothetical protein